MVATILFVFFIWLVVLTLRKGRQGPVGCQGMKGEKGDKGDPADPVSSDVNIRINRPELDRAIDGERPYWRNPSSLDTLKVDGRGK